MTSVIINKRMLNSTHLFSQDR